MKHEPLALLLSITASLLSTILVSSVGLLYDEYVVLLRLYMDIPENCDVEYGCSIVSNVETPENYFYSIY